MADKSFFDNISTTDYITLENTRDNHESLFSIMIYNISKEIFLKDLNDKLKKIQEIKNSFKKKKLNDRLYKFIQKIELDNKDIYNNVFLISDDILSFNLTKKDFIILKEWNVNNYMFMYDEYFKLEYLKDLLTNINFYDIIINNTHFKGNLNKKKIIKDKPSLEYLKTLSVPFFYCGKLPKDMNNKNMIENLNVLTSWNDAIELINKTEIKNENIKLQTFLDEDNKDKYIYKDEIFDEIENYNIKILYVHKEIKELFLDEIKKRNLIQNLNFEINYINTIKGISDSSNILLIDYCGYIGLKYY
jgi:hypothetical protein